MNIRLSTLPQKHISSSEDIYAVMQRILMRENRTDRDREHFWTVSLDNAHKILNIELVSMGSVTRTLVEPMEVFSIPLQKRAVKLVLIHNHPSGTLKPSEADKDVTDRLIQVGRIMQVPVLDHLIITEKTYYSFADSGLLDELQKSLKYVPAYEIKYRQEQAAKEGEKKGKEKGLKEGEQKGEKKKAIEMARVMKEKKYPIEEIIALTGLSRSAIQAIKTEKKQ